VARALELEALRQQEEKMRLEIVQIKETTDRYKKELTVAMQRESSLEQSRAQLEVDWQRRCEGTEREVYAKQEQLITGLTKQRDEVRTIRPPWTLLFESQLNSNLRLKCYHGSCLSC